ncbi:hypothetical protein KAH43_01520 [Candidatus Bipolaricaulota bacterium]|nr:hypothetical protein [Candidatus Bipolaricaulota bacterium]
MTYTAKLSRISVSATPIGGIILIHCVLGLLRNLHVIWTAASGRGQPLFITKSRVDSGQVCYVGASNSG